MQGFVFNNPHEDFPMWERVTNADLENPAFMCTPDLMYWLMGKAIEATLFQIYLIRRRKQQSPANAL
ncbi:hypothetical protein GCM10027578_04990 [Spirosoma luteolum]